MAYELIETIELASSASSITFSSIPQDYTDLVVVLSARTGRTLLSDPVEIQPNSSTTNLSSIRLVGNGSAVSSSSFSAIYTHATGNLAATTDTFASSSIYISNYTASQAKSISVDAVLEADQTTSDLYLYAGLWDDTTAITSMKLDPIVDFDAGTTASLYGIS